MNTELSLPWALYAACSLALGCTGKDKESLPKTHSSAGVHGRTLPEQFRSVPTGVVRMKAPHALHTDWDVPTTNAPENASRTTIAIRNLAMRDFGASSTPLAICETSHRTHGLMRAGTRGLHEWCARD